MKRTRISILLAIVLLLQLCVPLTANAADFTPNPQTEYAKRFIAACDGQTWFINEIERLLNAQQRTLDRELCFLTAFVRLEKVIVCGQLDFGFSATSFPNCS